MLSKEIIEKVYAAACMQRWNDHIRPVELTELDKQAHKMIIAYIIAKFEEERGNSINWMQIIEGDIFEFLYRVTITDIKPPIFHKIMKEHREKINEWVIERIKNDIPDIQEINGGKFFEKFREYFKKQDSFTPERKILRAAHYLATNWEFRIIYNTSPYIYGIDKTKEEIENAIEDHYDLIGVQQILLGKRTFGFIDLCGQLRFQQRWSHTPRIPRTSVLGHLLVVAIMTYFASLGVKDIEEEQIRKNFFGALFHDLPEILTRDIISPIKNEVGDGYLKKIIKKIEKNQIEEKLLPLLPSSWHQEIVNYIDSKENYKPPHKDLIEICDKLSAFVEASLSLQHGIKSEDLENGLQELHNKYKDYKIEDCEVDFGRLFEEFYEPVKKTITS
ncbi:MAG: HD domain-containing protein [Thermoplasmata archaeon]|nr:HD domain-containing protein [Thermoplasmata archaeon]